MADTREGSGHSKGKDPLPPPAALHFPLLWASLLLLTSDRFGATLEVLADSPEVANGHRTPLMTFPHRGLSGLASMLSFAVS